MSNIIEGINNTDSDETSGCRLVEMLEKNLAILHLEARQIEKMYCDVEAKLENFNELSNSNTSKLRSLMMLSELRFGDKNEIKEFVEKITLSWLRTNKQMTGEDSGIYVASRTAKGTPLSVLLEQKKKESAAIKIALQIGSVIYNEDYVVRGYKIYEEITELLEYLKRCDDKVQQYMVMCKTMPRLIDLSSMIDRFVRNTDLLPSPMIQSINKTEDLSVFQLVSRLLTGELFGHQVANPRQILAENPPRKPVFITLNNKRKLETSKISKSKISRSLSLPYDRRFSYK